MVTSSLELPLTPHRKWGKGKKRARKSFQKFPALVKKYHTSNFPVAHGHDDDKYDDKRATHKLQYDFMLLAYLSDIKFTCMQIVPVGNKRRLFFETDREPSLTVTTKRYFTKTKQEKWKEGIRSWREGSTEAGSTKCSRLLILFLQLSLALWIPPCRSTKATVLYDTSVCNLLWKSKRVKFFLKQRFTLTLWGKNDFSITT